MSTVLLIYKCPDLFPDGSCRCYCQVILCYTLFSECDCRYIWCAILKKVYLYTLNCHFILYRYNKRSEHTSTFFILENKRRLIQFIVGISNSDFFLTGKVRSLFLNLEPLANLHLLWMQHLMLQLLLSQCFWAAVQKLYSKDVAWICNWGINWMI